MQDKQITQLPGSLITDTSYNNQPEGSHSFALNAVPETTSGDRGFISNEPGNLQCLNFNGYSIIGSINLNNGENVLFGTNGSNSRIYLQKDCTLNIIVDTSCLNFSDLYPITGVAKIRKGCNRVIYFRDSFNSDRSIDIDEILNNPSENRYYDGTWKCELFKLAPDFEFPCIDYVRTNNSGGNLKLGVYQFGIALGDEDLNFSNVLSITQPIPIINGTLNSDNNRLEGGDPNFENATTKSIDLSVSNLDLNYNFIKFYVIETIGGVITAYEADTLAINNTTLNYTYRGVDYNSAIVVELEKINSPFIVYDKSKTMEQHDNRLLRGNLKERTINNSVFQRAANLIKTRYVTKPILYSSNSSVFSGDYYVDNRSYMRDEVYALAISAVYTDGTESPKYHIPGRLLDKDWNDGDLPAATDPFAQNGSKQHNRKDPLTGWDSTEYTVIDTETYPKITGNSQNWNFLLDTNNNYVTLGADEVGIEDTRPLNIDQAGSKIKRWQVYNTSYIDEVQNLNNSYYTKGQFSYWESEYPYPSIEDCNGNRIYPEGNIRHHKMPDTTLEPHFIYNGSDTYILSLGVEFNLQLFKTFLQSNLGLEYNDIQGFKISRAKRDRGNKSIIDKGVAYRTLEMLYSKENNSSSFDQYLYQTAGYNKHAEVNRNSPFWYRYRAFGIDYQNTNVTPNEITFDSDVDNSTDASIRHSYEYISIHNPQSQYNKDTQFQFIKMEKELFSKYEFWGSSSTFDDNNTRSSIRTVYNNYNVNSNYKGTPHPFFTNRLKKDASFVPANENITFDSKRVINKTQQEFLITKLDNYMDISNDGISYGGSPQELDGSRNGNIEWAVSPTGLSSNYTKSYYISLKNYNPSQYGQLHGLIYYDINSCLIDVDSNTEILFGGDIFISQMSFRKTYTDQTLIDLDERTWFSSYITYFVESEINCKLRHEGYDGSPSQWYYPYHGTNTTDIYDVIFRNDFNLMSLADEDASIEECIDNYLTGNYCFNQYNYNQDYSQEQTYQPKFPLYLGYDYCSNCINEYPNRIVYSEKSYQEEIFDNYRKFLPNNYRDIQANTGEIQNIFKESDNLYIRTLHSLWFVPSKYQNLEGTGGTINIGTGELFSIPPKEITSTKYGYNGGQTTLDLVINEYGAFYADSSTGIVFQVGGEQQQVEISKTGGNRIWFEQNLPFNLLKHNPSFPYIDSPTSKTGIGLIGYYDAQFRRYILTKRDYYPIFPDTSTFDATDNVWYVGYNGTQISVNDPYNSPFYFENRSWTISYYLEDKKWVSWHSYIPNFAWGDLNNFYSYIKTNNYIWQHNKGEYGKFYGTKYPHIIEYVVTKDPTTTKVNNSISYISTVSEYNSTYKYWNNVLNKTFTQALFYNERQSTGVLDISIKNTIDPFASVLGTFDPSIILADQIESNWNINNIRDMVDQTNPEQPLFSKNWSDLQSQYYIDKVPNMNIINYLTKSQFEMELLRDTYMVSRLIFKPVENYRITTKYIGNKYDLSPR